jgi:hypothetical protein
MPLRSDPTSYQDYEELVDHYTASVEFLRNANEDMQGFIDALVDVNNTYSTKGPSDTPLQRTFWEGYYGQMGKQAVSGLMPPTVILSAELEAMPVQSAAERLCDRLERMVERFGRGVADALAELQSVELVGRVEWKTPTACDSFYYEDTILHEHVGREVIELSPPEEVSADYERMVRWVQQEVRTVSKDRHVVRHGLHVKILGKAERSPVDRYSKVIPEPVQEFLRATPVWLRELSQIVSGKVRTDLVVGRDIFVEEREVAVERKESWPEPCACPLVTVGDYVLTGWGAKEADVEEASQLHGGLYSLAVALVALAAISMGLARLGNPLWSYAAPLAATLSLAVFIEACRKRAVARGEVIPMSKLIGGGLAWFVLASGVMSLAVAVATESWVLGIVGGVVTVIAGLLVRRVLRGSPRSR